MKIAIDDGTYIAEEIPHRKKAGSRQQKSSALVTESVSIDELNNDGEYKDAKMAMIYNSVKHYKTDGSKGLKENEFSGDEAVCLFL